LFKFILHSAVQGASINILSKLFSSKTHDNLVASCCNEFTMLIHCFFILYFSFSSLILFNSKAVISQLFSIKVAICVVLLQGALQVSNTFSQDFGFKIIVGI
jgi:uncharacterized membrane protein (DUF485 family)